MRKRPIIYVNRIGDYTFLWVWKICLIFICNEEHTHPLKFLEIWKNKRSAALIFGKNGIGVGHSFGLEN